jgi:predicted transcriptional regulator
MSSATVRISNEVRDILRELAAKEGEPMQAILEKAIEQYRRQRFLEEVNAAYAALRQDYKIWTEIQKELKEWDSTLADGIDLNEEWTQDGEATRKNKGGKVRD